MTRPISDIHGDEKAADELTVARSARSCVNAGGDVMWEYPAVLPVRSAYQAQPCGGNFALGHAFSKAVQYKGAYA